MNEDQLKRYAKAKHILINCVAIGCLIAGITLLFWGVITDKKEFGEIITGATILITPSLGIMGFENHIITKFLFFMKNKKEK